MQHFRLLETLDEGRILQNYFWFSLIITLAEYFKV